MTPTDIEAQADTRTAEELRDEILRLTHLFHKQTEAERRPHRLGKSLIQYAGRVWDEAEMTNLVDSSLQFWLTAGKYATKLEKALAKYLGVAHASLVNSGSSANLVAFSALTSPQLGERRIMPGDEVITVAAGFPTTVAPVIQNRAIPVFVDVRADTVEIDVEILEAAHSSRTKAVFVAHTLGNPFDIDGVLAFCERHGLWLIEDNCDALGSMYTTRRGDQPETRPTGSFGHLATSSFYPAHHITTGEGGAVYTSDDELKLILESFRDWGRDCYCLPGQEDTCGMRFAQQFGVLPYGYDHKYVYSHFGYNLKMTDMSAAVGLAQLDKLDEFGAARRRNAAYFTERLTPHAERLQLPQATPHADPSWFGFLMQVRDQDRFTRDDIVQFLQGKKIQTRMLFAGNLLAHPCFDEMRVTGEGYRVVGELTNTDHVMNHAFWIGVYPGLTAPQLEYIGDSFDEFFAAH